MKAVVIVGVLSVSFRGVSIVVSLGINCWGCVRVEAQVGNLRCASVRFCSIEVAMMSWKFKGECQLERQLTN